MMHCSIASEDPLLLSVLPDPLLNVLLHFCLRFLNKIECNLENLPTSLKKVPKFASVETSPPTPVKKVYLHLYL